MLMCEHENHKKKRSEHNQFIIIKLKLLNLGLSDKIVDTNINLWLQAPRMLHEFHLYLPCNAKICLETCRVCTPKLLGESW